MIKDEDFFTSGGFSPEWASDTAGEIQPQVKTEKLFKDRETLLNELREIKQRMQDIRAKEWQLAKLLEFHSHKLAKE